MSERNVLGMQVQLALAAVVIAALAVPVLAQSDGGIAGVLPAGAVPELVKEGFVGTEGPRLCENENRFGPNVELGTNFCVF